MIIQIALLFATGLLVIGIITVVWLEKTTSSYITSQTYSRASHIAQDIDNGLESYPACDWLIRYWYDNYDTLDLEYDAPYVADSPTALKVRDLAERVPDFSPEYASEEDVLKLSPEDQKLYAEIVYAWVCRWLDDIMYSYELERLDCVIAEEPYESQFMLISALKEGLNRNDAGSHAYQLGTEVRVSETQEEAMRISAEGGEHEAIEKGTSTFYFTIGDFDGHNIIIRLASDHVGLREMITYWSRNYVIVTLVCLTVLAIFCLILITLIVLRPLRKVQKSVRLYKETKESDVACAELAAIKSHNEIGLLSDDVADMTREIDEYTDQIQEVTSREEHIKTELELASRIQKAMLPGPFPLFKDRREFSLYASMAPAREVGGDFYDCFLVDDDHLCLVVADVSGKGIPAALYMMASKITFSYHARDGKSPAQILIDANDAICANNPEGMFVTLWIGLLEISTGVLSAANAGHEYPIVKHPGGRYEVLRDDHGFVLGIEEGIVYKEYSIKMEKGSAIFLYTDGLPEATDENKEMFGIDRAVTQLNKDTDRPAKEILPDMTKAVADFVKDAVQFDDLTMMYLVYNGPDDE